MAEKLNTIVQLFLALSMLLVLLGTSYVVLKSSVSKAKVEELRQSLNDARQDNTELRAEQDRTNLKLEQANLRITHLEEEKVWLTEMVTQKANVDGVLDHLDEHHKMAMKKADQILEKLDERSDAT